MSGLEYRGKPPNSDGSVIPRSYADTQHTAQVITNSIIDTMVSSAIAENELMTTTYVNTQDALRASKSAVDTADATYLPTSARGVASGVASTGSDNYIPSGQLPTLLTDRLIGLSDFTITLAADHVATTNTTKDFSAGTCTVSDPGFPYLVLWLGQFTGFFTNTTATRDVGGGSYGKAVVLDDNDVTWAGGVSSGSHGINSWPIVPTCAADATPSTIGQLTGSHTFTLYLSLWSGSTWTFTATDTHVLGLVYPAA